MRAKNWWRRLLLLLLVIGAFQLPAQQSETDRKWLAEVRAKAEKGDAHSQYELGRAFDFGNRGVTQDAVEAVKWYWKAAAQNHAEAQCDLGICYANGRGVAQDEAEAVKWFRKAAEQNHASAQYNLGVCYDNGRGVAQDEAEAVKWFRKAAAQNHASAQFNLGVCYAKGQGVAQDEAEAVKWYRKAAAQNHASAQYNLGVCYAKGQGVAQDYEEAVKWFRKAAAQNYASAQCALGVCYDNGQGVAQDEAEAVKWYRKAAEQNVAEAQYNLGICYAKGEGVAKDEVEGYKWFLLAAGQGDEKARKLASSLEKRMTRQEIAEGQKRARNFKPREAPSSGSDISIPRIFETRPEGSGTGFFITEDGYLITNEHVAGNGALVRVVTQDGILPARVVKVDSANDLALLKAEGRFAPLPLVSSRDVKLGRTVATVGFPNIGLQGFAPKLAKGEIAALSGAQDDPRYFQISAPVQPGNSGGALVDERGNVVGVVTAKLSAKATLATSGALPENVNYAVKSSFLLSFLESVPEVAARLREPNLKDRKFEDVVKAAEQAAVLVLVY